MMKKHETKQAKISAIEITDEKLSDRGGLTLFFRFIENIGFYQFFEKNFSFAKRSGIKPNCRQFIMQLSAFFIDASDLSMLGFDRRKNDAGYAGLLENTPAQMASSHQMKRFFENLGIAGNFLYRMMLLRLFVWRLQIETPSIIELFIDSVVWDNNAASKRQGIEPT